MIFANVEIARFDKPIVITEGQEIGCYGSQRMEKHTDSFGDYWVPVLSGRPLASIAIRHTTTYVALVGFDFAGETIVSLATQAYLDAIDAMPGTTYKESVQ